MPLFNKGHIRLKREALINVILDDNLKPKEQNFFIRIVCLVWPYDFILRIGDGQKEKSIELRRGELYTSIPDLMKLASTSKKQSMLEMLTRLSQFQYINYTPRKSRHENIFLQVKDYDYYIDTTVPEIGMVDKQSTIPKIGMVTLSTVSEIGMVDKSTIPEAVMVDPVTVPKIDTVTEYKSSNINQKQFLKNNKEYVVNNKQQQEAVVEIQSLFKKKAKTKIPAHVCENLLSRFPLERIIQNIKRLNFNKADNPPGLLISSLEEDWDIPISEEERMEVEEKIREEEIEKKKREWEKAKQEAIPAEQAVEKISVIRSFLKGVGIK